MLAQMRAGNQTLSFENGADVFKPCADVTLREADLPQPMNIRELFAPLLKENYCSGETEAALKEPDFMYNVETRAENEERERRRVEQLV